MLTKRLFAGLIALFPLFVLANPVDQLQARKVAESFSHKHIAQFAGLGESAADIVVQMGNTPVYYVINLKPQGFIMVPAWDAAPPVFGYSTESNYFTTDQPENFQNWMDGCAQIIKKQIDQQIAPSAGIAGQWNSLLAQNNNKSATTVTTVGPLFTSTWNQGSPYNYLCPVDPTGSGGHVWAGCVATAMAQVMYYWRYPAQGSGSHGYYSSYGYLSADFGNTTYNWNEMTNAALGQNFEMAQLQLHLGISVNMMYSGSGSGAYSEDAADALRTYFGYDPSLQLVYRDNYTYENWKTLLHQQLDLGQPMYYHGFGTGGHAFNVDGYQDTMYFHFNWGWGGSYNGYYHLFNLNPGGDDFTNGQGAIINFVPAAGANVQPCNPGSICTKLQGSFEDGSGPVAPYFGNANCGWLIDPGDTLEYIRLSFDRFDLENGKDFLNVYDGADAYAPLLASLTGNSIPPSVDAHSGKMYITFTSDGSGNSNGWLASYFSKQAPFCSGSTTTLTAASGRLTDGSGSFNYRDNAICKYKLVPPDAKSITLNFNSFNTYDGGDILKIFDLESEKWLYVLSGNTNPGTLTCNTGQLYILFLTDNANTAPGWDFSYTSSTVVGMQSPTTALAASVYPNPAQSTFTIEASDLAKNAHIELFTTDGRLALKAPCAETGTTRIDVSGLERGMYILQLTSGPEKAHYKVILK